MVLINHANIGEVQKIAYLSAVITAVYGTGEADEYKDTVDFTGVGNCPAGSRIPLFYHCAADSAQRDNGALEGASAAFSIDDEVIVQCEITGANSYKPLRVIGFTDKPKACVGWLEDWPGPEITSNHDWTGMVLIGNCLGAEEPNLITFNGDNKVLKVSHACYDGGGMCILGYANVNFLTSEKEVPLNCGLYSGFSARIYIESLTPDDQITLCECVNCHYAWEYAYFVVLYIRKLDLSQYLEPWYGFACSYRCDNGVPKWGGQISYAALKAKVGNWSDMPIYPGDPEVWGNSNYEIWKVGIYSYIVGSSGGGDSPTLLNMSSVFYIDDIKLY